jgi:hypothetical protein
MNNQLIGILMVFGSLAWMAFGDKLKAAFQGGKPTIPHDYAAPLILQDDWKVQSRVDAVKHCEVLMAYFESTENKTGAECMRTAISSIYAAKE